MTDLIVEYRLIEGHAGYRVGSDGSVWSCKAKGCRAKFTDTWHELRQARHSAGYRVVLLRQGRGNGPLFFVHRLVLEAFAGPCPEGMQCRHLDGSRDNNHLSNLAWGTPVENAEDRVAHGTQARGSAVHSAKLTEDTAQQALRMSGGGMANVAIASRLGVHAATISDLVRRRTWKHVLGLRAVTLIQEDA